MGNVDQVRRKTEQRPKEKKNAFIVAIGGLSGAGKTALVERVDQTLGESVTFFYDYRQDGDSKIIICGARRLGSLHGYSPGRLR
ncbi:hypothetical protein ACFL6S_22840 [Candidatus Poribacteria bacterium]